MHNNSNTTIQTPPGGLSDKRRKVKLPPHSQLNAKAVKHFDVFVESVPPARLSRSLRDLFLLYLSYDSMPDKLEELSADMYFLLHFLDEVGHELDGKIRY